ncbi:MAG: hypothetical protein WDZ35_05025 [Crocinitomicaceae bacterium]
MVKIGALDWVIWLVYVVLIGLILLFYKNSRKDQELYRYFLPGFFLSVFGGVAFAMIYIYYYKGGDSLEYFKNAHRLTQILFENPSAFFDLISYESGQIPREYGVYTRSMGYSSGYEEWFMVRVLSVFNIIGFNFYLVTTLLISFISFLGSWKLFLVFCKYVNNKSLAFIAVFVTPSVLFWGNGILKDTMVMFCLSMLIWSYHKMVYQGKFKWNMVILFLFFSYLTFRFKSYVFILFLPALLDGFVMFIRRSIKLVPLRVIITPLLITLMGYFAYKGVIYLSEVSNKYDIEGIEKKVKGFHSWHQYQGGSTYNLGEIEYTVTGVLKKIPASWNVTFFRPYLWEVKNIVMALGAIESTLFFLLFLRLLFFKTSNWHYFFSDSFFLILTIFILLLGFVVGFTSFNFGALARYKIPILPMLMFLLLALNFDSKFKKDSSGKNQ